MLPKPSHLGEVYAAQFEDDSVARAYPTRPPYPDEVFSLIAASAPSNAPRVLDLGCGTGDLARRLTAIAERVDAVDRSAAMIAEGKSLLGGDAPNLRWIVGRTEDAPLDPPYDLVTAAESLHWMEWQPVLQRVRAALVPGGSLVVIERHALPLPWDDALLDIIQRYSTNREFSPYNFIGELTARGLVRVKQHSRTQPVPFRQPIGEYIESFHSRNGFSRERMMPDEATAFDEAVRALVVPYVHSGTVEQQIVAQMTWCEPLGQA